MALFDGFDLCRRRNTGVIENGSKKYPKLGERCQPHPFEVIDDLVPDPLADISAGLRLKGVVGTRRIIDVSFLDTQHRVIAVATMLVDAEHEFHVCPVTGARDRVRLQAFDFVLEDDMRHRHTSGSPPDYGLEKFKTSLKTQAAALIHTFVIQGTMCPA